MMKVITHTSFALISIHSLISAISLPASSSITYNDANEVVAIFLPKLTYGLTYKFRVYTPWAEGEQDCILQGGHLVSVHSQEEYDAVLSVVKYDWGVWIGGSDQAREGEWSWTDGTPWGWSKWAPADMPPDLKTFPQNTSGANCLIQRTLLYPPTGLGFWVDVLCSDSHQYVCNSAQNIEDRHFYLDQLARLVFLARGQGVDESELWNNVEKVKTKYMTEGIRVQGGIFIQMRQMIIKPGVDRCEDGLLTKAHIGMLTNTVIGKFDFFKNTDCNVTFDDLVLGYKLYTYISLCQLDTLNLLDFYKHIVATRNPQTIIQTANNNAKPGVLSDKSYTDLARQIMQKLDSIFNFPVGKQVGWAQ